MAWSPHGSEMDPALYLSPIAVAAIVDAVWPGFHAFMDTLAVYVVAAAVVAAMVGLAVFAWLVWGPLPTKGGRR